MLAVHPDAPAWTAGVDNPYLHGLYAPTVHETCAFDLEIDGERSRAREVRPRGRLLRFSTRC